MLFSLLMLFFLNIIHKMINSKYYRIFFILFFLIFANIGLCIDENNFSKITTIIIDAGHGGKDPGTISLTGTYEKDIVLPIALKLKFFINKNFQDLKVVLTRNKNEFIELKDRGIIANSNKGNLFISIHCNAKKSEENDKNGFEIYLLDLVRIPEAIKITENLFIENFKPPGDSSIQDYIYSSIIQNSYYKYSEKFSSILQTEMALNTSMQSRGVFQAGFLVLLEASMPCVLIECGYLSNKIDEEYLKSSKGQDEIAKAIYKAIRFYKIEYEFENKFF